MSSADTLHRRKSSREDDNVVTFTVTEPVLTNGHEHPSSPRKTTFSSPNPPSDPQPRPVQRQRVVSTPSHPVPPSLYAPASAGPLRTNFNISSSHFRNMSIHGHARSPSSSSFYPPSPSPLSASFPAPASPTNLTVPGSPVAHRPAPAPPSVPPDQRRRHSRIHSRNLSIYFPRPGATLPPASIAEDGAQELELGNTLDVPETVILSAPLQQGRELEAGFTFGGRKTTVVEDVGARPGSATHSRPSRRGHHHKHSLSHNFFSFMEPDVSAFTPGAPTPTPASASFPPSSPAQPRLSPSPTHDTLHHHDDLQAETATATETATTTVGSVLTSSPSLIAIGQFVLGSALWVRGQQCGSLACTGLGYWVVFDAFGVACTGVLPRYLASASAKSNARPYGNARLETLAVFAQSIYLVFASVYVSKEAVEHMLLSHGEGHHHHRGDDTNLGIEFPTRLVLISFLSLIATSLGFDNHSRLINATANRIPSLSSLIQSFQNASKPLFSRPPPPPPPTTMIGRAASNPYTALPAGVALCVICIYALIDVSQHRPADLFVAAVLAALTFGIAYPAALALAKVLLQTAPERGMASGRMEAFLRAMRDLERHPQVLHLPPPHIWQLTPASHGGMQSLRNTYHESPATLVVTLELHVRRDLDDAAVLELTRWAWDRCTGALGGDRGRMGREDDWGVGAVAGVAEVTVGVVRG